GDHFLGGLNPGVSPSNGFFVLFGQFFDHGLDFIGKASGQTIKIALASDDPLYGMLGPDGRPVHEITINRATVQTVDANGPEYVNHTSPFIDQSQTYGSHEQLTNLLREWVADPATGQYHAGMNLFDGQTLEIAWTKPDGTATHQTLPTLDELRAHVDATGRDALTWEDVNDLRNRDASGHVIAGTSGSALLLDMNPRFDAGHMGGFYDKNGNGAQDAGEAAYGTAAQSAKVAAAISTIDTYAKFTFGAGSSFGIDATTHKLTLTMATLPPGSPPGTPHTLDGASSLFPFVNFADFSITVPAGALHDAVGEILMASVGDHYVAGDGRVNENFGLTSIHHVFHEEHNYQIQNIIEALHTQDVVSGAPTHAALHGFQIDTGHGMNAAGDYLDAAGNISWDQDKMFNGAKLVVEMEYQHAAVDQYARNVSPNIQEFGAYSTEVDSAISLEYSQAAFRFGHSTLRETIDTIDPSGGLTGKIMGYALKAAFLAPDKFADVGPSAIVLGMTHQQMNEVDEFVTPALNQGLLDQPLDLAAINIARGRDVGIPTLNEVRHTLGYSEYSSWNDFGQNMQHPSSLANFIAAYAFDGDMEKANTIVGIVDGSVAAGTLGISLDQAYGFMNGDEAAGGVGTLAFNQIDTWLGGLAEVHQPGGLLGETFDRIFVDQIEKLMDGDRFYYLYRLFGVQFGTEIVNAQLKDMVERTTGLTHLNGNIFGYADQYVDLGAHKEVLAPGQTEYLTTGNEHKYGDIAAVDAGTIGIYSNGGRGNLNDGHEVVIGGVHYIQDTRLADTDPNSAYGQNGFANLDGTPNSGAESNEIIVGSKGQDLIYAQGGDDTVYGDAGNDKIYGSYGIDRLYGGDGSDTIYGGDNPDLIDGGAGDDFLYGESSGTDINGLDQVIGGAGNDYINGGLGIDKLFGGNGDDVMYGEQDTDPFFEGNDGNDYLDGGSGTDMLYGSNGDDMLLDGTDVDISFGQAGDDWFKVGDIAQALSTGPDEVLGGDGVTDDGNTPGTVGFDVLDFSLQHARPVGVTYDLDQQANPLTAVNAAQSVPAAFEMEGLVGSVSDDNLGGDSGDNWVVGG
ncbi:heme peroxidase, partial [Bradyrhizobium sp. 24]|nr:heme peroxidase [Bradyrhizobium sp. 24]